MWKQLNKLKGVDLKLKNDDIDKEIGSIMMKSVVPQRMMNEWRGIYQMQGNNIELYWEEERWTCYLMDEYVWIEPQWS